MNQDSEPIWDKYRKIFELSPYVIFLIDKEGKVLEINSIAQKVFGCGENETPDFGERNFFSHEDDFTFLKNSLKSGEEISARDFSFVSKSGKKVPCMLTTSIIDKENGIYLGICNDNSAQKKKESSARTSDRFKTVAKVARTLAHEIRNPLTNINLALEQLILEMKDREGEEMFFLDLIGKNSERINTIVTQMLDALKIEEPNWKSYPIRDLIEESLNLANQELEEKNIRVVKSFDENISRIKVDPDRMKVALTNIFLNAEEMMESGGTLQVSTQQEGDKCIISITDSRKKIEAESLDQIFEPVAVNKTQGDGFALTVAQGIIVNHQGNIQMKNENGKGITFIIELGINEPIRKSLD